MQINIEAIRTLIQEKYRGNQTFFAEILSVDAHYFNQIMKGKQKASSPKTCRCVIEYCKNNNLEIDKYIIF